MTFLQKLIKKLSTKEILWSTFLVFSLLFPWLNSFEIVFYGTQKTFLVFCFWLWLSFIILFKLNHKVYDFTINLFFSNFSKPFIFLCDAGSKFTAKYPRFTGVFYAVCLISILARFENSNSYELLFINSILLFLRNLLVLPYIGYVSLLNWIIIDLSRKNISKEMLDSSFKDYNLFSDQILPVISLLNQDKSVYNKQTSRNIYKLVSTVVSIPGREAITITTKTLFGVSLPAYVALTTYTSGQKLDTVMDSNFQITKNNCSQVLNHPNSSAELKAKAIEIETAINLAKTHWNFGSYLSPVGLKGARSLISSSKQSQEVNQVAQLTKESFNLVHDLKKSQLNTKASSVLEITIFDFFF